jgi:hypothetical protein
VPIFCLQKARKLDNHAAKCAQYVLEMGALDFVGIPQTFYRGTFLQSVTDGLLLAIWPTV